MPCTLILTDEVARGERMVRILGSGSITVHDLYGDAAAPTGSGLIIADVSATTSESMLRLRRCLAGAGKDVPLLYIVHGSLQRGELQGAALGAKRVLPATRVAAMLKSAVASLCEAEDAAAVPGPSRGCDAARAAFKTIFTADAPPPERVDAATDIVNQAIRENDVCNWLDVVARFDDATHRHCLTVAGLAAAFGQHLRLNEADAHRLTRGALLHDIGKAQLPLAILNKPGPLTSDERRVIDRHPTIGHAMLLNGDYDAGMLAVVRSHHEYLDGSGYPDGLSGREIPDLVRLVTICDIFAALIEQRAYKAPMTIDQAYGILEQMGTKLDPALVRAFGAVAAACKVPSRRPVFA